MSTMIQVRNVPDSVHRHIKSRAALAGMSMSEYILRELKRSLERPTRDELLRKIAALPEVNPQPTPADILRAERDAR